MFARLPRRIIARAMTRAGLGASISPASIRNRSPRARRSPSCRCCASPISPRCRRRRRRSAASTSRRPARRSGCSCRPGRSSSRKATASDFGGAARALFAAGFRAGDIVHNSFSYHLTPGGFILEAGAHALGCAVIPGGVGNTEQQLEAIAHLQADRLCRHAGLPEDPARYRARSRQGRVLDQARRWCPARRCRPRCARNSASAASRCCSATPSPKSASSPTRATRAKA